MGIVVTRLHSLRNLRARASSVLRSSLGAFDMMSVIAGAAVVAVLVVGTLTNAFGVIPWVQDSGAHQDLGAVRTAQSVAKAKDGRFMDDAGLKGSSYLTAAGSVAVGADSSGSCWVGFSRSEAGNTFFTTTESSEPAPYSRSLDTGCVERSEQKRLATAVGTPIPPTALAGWGYNYSGQLGNGAKADSAVPTATVTAGVLAGKDVHGIDADRTTTCAIADGSAFCWGGNTGGILGNGSAATDTVTPVAVSTAGPLEGKQLTKIAVGTSHACGIASGQAYCWGSNAYGQLGNDTVSGTGVLPIAVAGILAGKTVTDIDAAADHTCAVADAKAFCWGRGDSWDLGNGSDVNRTLPTPVTATGALLDKTVTKISTGVDGACVIADGSAYCWGFIGSVSKPRPAAIAGDITGKTVTTIATGDGIICGVADGRAYCWGRGGSGSSGTGVDLVGGADVSWAVDTSGVLADKTVTAVSAGLATVCVLAEGAPYCWGYNQFGQVGNNTKVNASLPQKVETPPFLAGKTAILITIGARTSFAVYE